MDTGDVIGTAYIVIDATTVGLDVMEEPYTYKIRQNTPASYAVVEALEEWGYEYEYSGSMDVGFYLRRISRGGMMDYPAIPENLWSKILQDGLTLTGQTDNNSLGEFDYTQGSGWMYSHRRRYPVSALHAGLRQGHRRIQLHRRQLRAAAQLLR